MSCASSRAHRRGDRRGRGLLAGDRQPRLALGEGLALPRARRRAAVNAAEWRRVREVFDRASQLPAARSGRSPRRRLCRRGRAARARSSRCCTRRAGRELYRRALGPLLSVRRARRGRAPPLAPASIDRPLSDASASSGAAAWATVYLGRARRRAVRAAGRDQAGQARHGHRRRSLRRFRTERQILAGFDHPNIARLLDGGTTETACRTS